MTDTGTLQQQTTTAKLALSLMDLTSLDASDNAVTVSAMAERADTSFGAPAALCIWPHLVPAARAALMKQNLKNVRLATVTNFPHGGDNATAAAREAAAAIEQGADEIDVVFPWSALLDGNTAAGQSVVAQSRKAAGSKVLKVILETGMLRDPALIRQAGEISIAAGADFLKTSTGKVDVNATPDAARIMLETIRDCGRKVGFKASGGIRTVAEAWLYLDLAEQIMGPDWISPETFRFGASGLLADILATLGHKSAPPARHGY